MATQGRICMTRLLPFIQDMIIFSLCSFSRTCSMKWMQLTASAVGIDDCRFIRRDKYVGTRSGMRCTGEQSGVSSLNSRTGHSVISNFFTNCTQIYCRVDWSLHFSVKNHKTSMHAPISFHQDSAALSQSIPSAYAGEFSHCCFMWLAMCSENYWKKKLLIFIYLLFGFYYLLFYIFFNSRRISFMEKLRGWRRNSGGGCKDEGCKTCLNVFWRREW